MAIQTDHKIFERAVEHRGRLLRVEADRGGEFLRQVLLTFDVGRILLHPTPEGIRPSQAEESGSLAGSFDVMDEEEPWWRLLGNPLTAAGPGGIETGAGARGSGAFPILKLRFREESDNPRTVVFEATGSAIRISLEG